LRHREKDYGGDVVRRERAGGEALAGAAPAGGSMRTVHLARSTSSPVLDSDLNPGLAAELPASSTRRFGNPAPVAIYNLDTASAAESAPDLSAGLYAATRVTTSFPWQPDTPSATGRLSSRRRLGARRVAGASGAGRRIRQRLSAQLARRRCRARIRPLPDFPCLPSAGLRHAHTDLGATSVARCSRRACARRSRIATACGATLRLLRSSPFANGS